MTVPLPDGLLALLRRPSPCFVATVMPDGSPQLTQTWVTTDGQHVVINIVDGMQKARNIARDPHATAGRILSQVKPGCILLLHEGQRGQQDDGDDEVIGGLGQVARRRVEGARP